MTTTKLSRRRFLRQCCMAGAAFTAGSLLTPLFSGPSFAATEASGKLPSPSASGRVFQETQLLMGTFVTLSVLSASRAQAEDGMSAAFDEIRRLVAVFDRYDSTTALSTLNSLGRLTTPSL